MNDKGRLVLCSASMPGWVFRVRTSRRSWGTLLAGLRRSQQRKSSALAQTVWSQNTRMRSVVLVRFNCDENMSPPQVTSSVGRESDGAARSNPVHFWWGSVFLINAHGDGSAARWRHHLVAGAPRPYAEAVGPAQRRTVACRHARPRVRREGRCRQRASSRRHRGGRCCRRNGADAVRPRTDHAADPVDRHPAVRQSPVLRRGRRPEMPSTESRLACVAAAIARGHAGVECSARS